MAYSFSDNIQRGIIYLAKSDKEFLVQCDPIVRSTYFEFPQHQQKKNQNELMSDYKEELATINSLDENSIDNTQYYLDRAEEFAREQSLKEAILESVDFIKNKQFSKVEDSIKSALSVSRNVDLGVDYFVGIGDRW